MLKCKFLFVLLLLTLFNATTYAKRIDNYDDLMIAIKAAKQFQISGILNECRNLGIPLSEKVIFSAKLNDFLVFPDRDKALSSTMHFTNHDGPAYDYLKYTFRSDNTVEIAIIKLNAITYAIKDQSQTFLCSLKNAIILEAV